MGAKDLPGPGIRAFPAEQQRISRLPAFVQDDCGDGSDFPDIPSAHAPVGAKQHTLVPPTLNRSPSAKYKSAGWQKVSQGEWLTIDNAYKNMHAARESLLTKKNAECVQVRGDGDGEAACEELLQEVAKLLNPDTPKASAPRPLSGVGTSATRSPRRSGPWSVRSIAILLNQASATLAQAGWRMRNCVGTPLSPMQDADILQWDDSRPVAHVLSIQETKDFFPGSLSALPPRHIIVRREHHIFRCLPRTGAVGKQDSVTEIRGLDGEIATRKGLKLWQRAIIEVCESMKTFRGDETIVDAGDMTTIGEQLIVPAVVYFK
ncbi:hypothetical protein SVAN01_02640 [Stagonosporopsis vannaccii]|nr:hypothetical protein SVAN01_02640 [Stagonosporopsis vannaccii]